MPTLNFSDTRVIVPCLIPVSITLKLVFFDDLILSGKDAEITVARFFLDELGNFNSRPTQKKILTPYELKGY